MENFNTKNEIDKAFNETIAIFMAAPVMQAIGSGALTIGGYKSILREVYHYTKENPQIQAFATTYFRGNDRETVKMFLRHAVSEIGHEYLAFTLNNCFHSI